MGSREIRPKVLVPLPPVSRSVQMKRPLILVLPHPSIPSRRTSSSLLRLEDLHRLSLVATTIPSRNSISRTVTYRSRRTSSMQTSSSVAKAFRFGRTLTPCHGTNRVMTRGGQQLMVSTSVDHRVVNRLIYFSSLCRHCDQSHDTKPVRIWWWKRPGSAILHFAPWYLSHYPRRRGTQARHVIIA
jgi:hypothetical protein